AVGTISTWRQAQQASLEARRTSAVKDFLLDIFAGAAPDQTRGEQVTALELLDRSVLRLEQMADSPQLRAELQLTLAGIYRDLGQFPRARNLVDGAVGQNRADAAQVALEQGRISFAEGGYEAAETSLRQALIALGEAAGPDPLRAEA